ncbi:MAG: HAD hydrolase-like protein, partial [Solirubrobacterales bacterium]
DPAIFAPALELAGCAPSEALHVGDRPEEDLAGAEAAGIRGLLIDRNGGGGIASLAEIEDHLAP